MKSKLIIVGFCVILLVYGVIFILFKQRECRQLSCVSMNRLTQFKIQDIYQEKGNSFRALYKNGGDSLIAESISHLDANEGKQYVNAELARMKGLFSDAPAPYPGVISDEIVCGNSYRPVFGSYTTKEGLKISYLTGYLNNQFVFGSCDPSEIIYKGIVAYFYCPKNKQAFQFQIITDTKTFEQSPSRYLQLIQSLQCK